MPNTAVLSLLASILLAAASACAPASPAAPPSPDSGLADAGAPDAGPADAGSNPEHPLCVDGVSVDGQYPKGPYELGLFATAPDLQFEGVDEQGKPTTIWLHDYFEPCAAKSRLLVIRTGGAWCGPCRWDAAHTAELSGDAAESLEWLDLLVAGEDNAPATLADVATWRQRIDSPGRVAADPASSFLPLNTIREGLPFIVLVDTRTMTIQFSGGNLPPEFLTWRMQIELASLNGTPEPVFPDSDRFDGLFDRRQWDLIRDMKLPGAPPPDPTNAVADVAAAADLGRELFSDLALSPSGAVACSTCHDPSRHFADGLPTGQGVDSGDRNSPSVLFASHARWQFWDGRADSLWMQALGPLENPKEFGATRLFVAHAVFDRYRADYEALFGAMPPLDDVARFPSEGMPGDSAWAAMSAADQRSVNQVFVNVGKSLAAFERTLRASPNRLDAYIEGDLTALSAAEKKALQTFFAVGCIQCHYGPRLTDDAFHNLRFPTGRMDGQADHGRVDGVPLLLESEFTGTGPYSDAPDAGMSLEGLVATPSMEGAFKTPPLRGVADTAPYGHGGNLDTLRDVVEIYGTAGLPPDDPRAVGETEPWVQPFSKNHVDELVPFLELLTAEPVDGGSGP